MKPEDSDLIKISGLKTSVHLIHLYFMKHRHARALSGKQQISPPLSLWFH